MNRDEDYLENDEIIEEESDALEEEEISEDNESSSENENESEEVQDEADETPSEEAPSGIGNSLGGLKWTTLKNVISKKYFIPIVLIFGLFVLILVIVALSYGGIGGGFDYIAPKCNQMRVTFGSGENSESLSLSMEDYIISHIYSATKDFKEIDADLYRVLAIAINTEVQSSSSCSRTYIPEVDDIYQFEILSNNSEEYLQIQKSIKQVKDLVMVQKKSNQYYSVSIDGFCSYSSIMPGQVGILDPSNAAASYTIPQLSYSFPFSWVEENVNNWNFKNCPCNDSSNASPDCFLEEWNYPEDEEPDLIYVDGGTGTGVSIYAAHYFTSYEKKSYRQVLNLFYPNKDWELKSNDEAYADKNDRKNKTLGLNGYGYVEPKCTTITTTTKTSESGGQGSGSTISLDIEEYVEGVVYHEFRGANDLEAFKALAVAARSYVLASISNSCTINNSTATQTFTVESERTETASAEMIKEAVNQTRGIVITSGNSISRTEYDAFCFANKDSSYYTMLQGEYGAGGQKIPTSWVDANIHSSIYKNCPCNDSASAPSSCFSNGKYRDGGHGRGMSQYGMLYLAKEEGYDFKEILYYYYGNDIVLKSIYYNASGANVSTEGTEELHVPLGSFLHQNNSSIAEYNDEIFNYVMNAGPGTRSGVVAAATGLIATLSDNYNMRFPYTFSGGHNSISGVGRSIWSFYGVDPDWGTPGRYSTKMGYYNYYGPDCSSFVAWALRNGGMIISHSDSSAFKNLPGTTYEKMTEIDYNKVQPGDLLHHPGHIELIIAVDIDNDILKTAEASGRDGGMRISTRKRAKDYSVVLMDGYYNNAANINSSFENDYQKSQLR